MNILIVSQYFWPETFIINQIALKMVEKGHQVTVYTGKPNYPEGHIFEGYQKRGVQEEVYQDKIRIYRVPLRPRFQGGLKNLLFNYVSFVISGVRYARRFSKNRSFDHILVFGVSPITAAIPGIVLKWLTHANLSIWIQDLWPESVQSTGYVKNAWLLAGTRRLVKWIYAQSDILLVQSEAFVESVAQLSSKDKIVYYSNPADDMLYYESKPHQLPQHVHAILDNYFTIVFAGNIGTAQAVDTIIGAASLIEDLEDVCIMLVGSGSMLHQISNLKQEGLLKNVFLAGRYPYHLMPELFNKASALLVTLKDTPIYRLTVPCKVQAYLSAGKPIIASMNGEGARILQLSKAAIVCPSEDETALADGIRRIKSMDSTEREYMGRCGRDYFLQHFELNQQTSNLINILENHSIKAQETPCVS